MTEAEKIQVAAELIADEMYKRCGRTPSSADCLAIARQLHLIWEQRVQMRCPACGRGIRGRAAASALPTKP